MENLAKALSKMQSQLEGAKKKSKNPYYKSDYADLESVWEAIRKPLTDNGLSVVQFPVNEEDKIGVETTILHESGESLTKSFYMRPVKNDPQAVGSLITYFRRYSLSAVCGIAPIDDDGEAAMPRGEKYKDKRSKTKAEMEKEKQKKLSLEIIDRVNRLTKGQTKAQIKDFCNTHICQGIVTLQDLPSLPIEQLEDIATHLKQMEEE